MPQKNSVAYALLISLYRYNEFFCCFVYASCGEWASVLNYELKLLLGELQMGVNLCVNKSLLMQLKQVVFLGRQLCRLIDLFCEFASPLCKVNLEFMMRYLKLGLCVVRPEKGKGKPGQFGSSPRDWYSGWSCMKTLIAKGLVVKSSCPAK